MEFLAFTLRAIQLRYLIYFQYSIAHWFSSVCTWHSSSIINLSLARLVDMNAPHPVTDVIIVPDVICFILVDLVFHPHRCNRDSIVSFYFFSGIISHSPFSYSVYILFIWKSSFCLLSPSPGLVCCLLYTFQFETDNSNMNCHCS